MIFYKILRLIEIWKKKNKLTDILAFLIIFGLFALIIIAHLWSYDWDIKCLIAVCRRFK